MIPVPPNCQEIPGVILTLSNGHRLTPDGRETANFTERGVWDDEATFESFIDLLFREEPDAIAVAQTESAARDLPQLSNYMETPTHTAPPVALDRLVRLCVANHAPEELALGWLRYEALRRVNPRIFAEMNRRNLTGEFLDDIVTEALLSWKHPNRND